MNPNVKKSLQMLKPYSLFMLASLVCALISVLADLWIPIYSGNAIDLMIGKGLVDLNKVTQVIVQICLFSIGASLVMWAMNLLNQKITYSITRDLRNQAIEKVHRLPLSYLDTKQSGELISRIITDVETISDGLLMGLTQFFTSVLTLVIILIIMFTLNVQITMVVVALTPLSLLLSAAIAKKIQKYFVAQSKVRGLQTAMVNEMIDGEKVIKAFSHEKESLDEFYKMNEELCEVSFKATFFSSLINPSTRLINNIIYALVSLVSALFAFKAGLTIGAISIFLSYSSKYAKPFNEISGVVTELQNALACAGRLYEMLEALDEVKEKEDALEIKASGKVSLKNVSFCYNPKNPLIENLNLEVEPGQRIAIVGPTGCGKTTLINLLMRFYDVNEGAICLDDIDIRDLKRHSLRENYGMVLQDSWLKEGTIRDNICYGKPDATDEEVLTAAKASNAYSFIRRLPDGFNTMVKENGANLSTGQKQLLCIARAMLSLPDLLILDEATSSIDTRTEQMVQKAFTTMMEGRTCFIVAHRLSTIRNADKILVMDHGHIIEMGNHDDLLKLNGFYANLYNSQFDN